MDVDLEFLTGGVRYNRPYTIALPKHAPPRRAVPRFPRSPAHALDALLAHRDVCSRRAIFQRYDGVVRGTTAIPLGAADAGVICPIPGAPLGVALGGRGKSALRQARSAAGGRARGARSGAQRRRRRRAAARAHRLPELRRSDASPSIWARWSRRSTASRTRRAGSARRSSRATSASTTSRSRAARSRPRRSSRASAASTNIAHTASMAFKRAGSALYFVGAPEERVGGSVYADLLGIAGRAACRRSTTIASSARSRCCWRRYATIWCSAAHDVSDGGALVALAKMAFATRDGARIGMRLDAVAARRARAARRRSAKRAASSSR